MAVSRKESSHFADRGIKEWAAWPGELPGHAAGTRSSRRYYAVAIDWGSGWSRRGSEIRGLSGGCLRPDGR